MSDLRLESVSFSYGSESDKNVLNDISISVTKGTPTVIFGASGSGKTTLLQILGGILKPDKGRYIAFGEDIIENNDYLKLRRQISWVTQQDNLFEPLSVYENLVFFAKGRNIGTERIDDYVKKFNIEGLLNRYPKELSVGEKQRIAIIRSLISNSDLLIFDEPTAALDKVNSQILIDLLNDEELFQDVNVIIASHDYIFKNKEFHIFDLE
jgi:putative ABC transport system ATP-binding protein